MTLNATRKNGSSDKSCRRNNTLHSEKIQLLGWYYCTILKLSTKKGYTVKYHQIRKYISTASGNVGISNNIKNLASSALNAFALDLLFTIDAKAPSAKDATLNYSCSMSPIDI